MDILKKKNRIYLKIIITLCFLSSAGVGITSNSVGVFYNYVASDLNILRGTYIIHNTIATFALAIVALFVPKWLNSNNYRKLIIGAGLLSSTSAYLMSFQSNIIMFYILGLLRGCGNAFFAFVVISIIINNWFNKNHGLITSIIFGFSGISGAIFSPLFLNVIETYGWRIGYKVMGISIFLSFVPFIIMKYPLNPKDIDLQPYGGEIIKEETKSISNTIDPLLFVYVGLFAALIHFAAGNMQHLSAIALSRNYSLNIVSLFVSLSMIGNVTFKFITGEIADKKGAIFSNIFILIVTLLGNCLLLFINNSLLNVSGTLLFGAVFAETAVGLTLLTKEVFGIENYNKTYPIYALLGNASYAISTSAYGYLYDFSKTYDLGLIIGIILIILCILTVIISKRRLNKMSQM